MATLDARIKALEGGRSSPQARAIHITWGTPPGKRPREVTGVLSGGRLWQRLPDEPVETLRARAAAECAYNPWGIALLIDQSTPAT